MFITLSNLGRHNGLGLAWGCERFIFGGLGKRCRWGRLGGRWQAAEDGAEESPRLGFFYLHSSTCNAIENKEKVWTELPSTMDLKRTTNSQWSALPTIFAKQANSCPTLSLAEAELSVFIRFLYLWTLKKLRTLKENFRLKTAEKLRTPRLISKKLSLIKKKKCICKTRLRLQYRLDGGNCMGISYRPPPLIPLWYWLSELQVGVLAISTTPLTVISLLL